MNNINYISSMLACNFTVAILNQRLDRIPETDTELILIYCAVIFIIVGLAIYAALQRLVALNRTRWWALLLVPPFGWIAIACMTEAGPVKYDNQGL